MQHRNTGQARRQIDKYARYMHTQKAYASWLLNVLQWSRTLHSDYTVYLLVYQTQQTMTASLNSINRLVCVLETQCASTCKEHADILHIKN
jgi:hypothetical protein